MPNEDETGARSVDGKEHPVQTEAPYRLDGDSELVEAALEELEHYVWRADTPPGKSTLDPNLERCKEHLEALKRSVDPHPETEVETLSLEFEGSEIEVEILSPRGWEADSVSPTGCGWVSEDGEHRACYYVDEVRGGTTLQIDGNVVERSLTKQEAAERLSEFDEGGPSTKETAQDGDRDE